MAAIRRYVPRSPTELLSHILERKELVAAIRELPAAMLSRLIDRIGVEDSGDLIALATTEQLAALLDHDLWRADEAGFEERFDPQRFALWLQVMGEAGEEFLVRRLVELPVDLLTLAVNRLVLVIDMDALRNYYAGARDEAGQIESALEDAVSEEWEEFCLIARDVDAWEDVWNALLSLDRDHHARLRAILEQCCAMSLEYIHGQGGLYDVLTSDEMLENDALASRDDRRASQGFVSRSDARAFLELARDEQQPLAQRDPITAGYFRALNGDVGGHRVALPPARQLPSQAGAGARELMSLVADLDSDSQIERVRRLRNSDLGGRAIGRGSSSTQREGLAATRQGGAAEGRPLLHALSLLASSEPTLHATRTHELAYLANVILSGCMHRGRKLRPAEALEAAIAISNLGLELWPRAKAERSREGDVRLVLGQSCDRMFRLAWAGLQRDVVQVATEMLARRCALVPTARGNRAQKLLRDRNPHGLRELCAAHELGFAEDAFEVVLALAETLPWWPAGGVRERSPESTPWIASRAEFERARTQLRELDALPRADMEQ